MSAQPATAGSPAGRFLLEKKYEGALAGTAVAEMLTGMTSTQGSAGYVAIERVSGSLAGQTGSFLLQHHGIMHQGRPQLLITVIPDSGTEGFSGLTGRMNITIGSDGSHTYELDYSLPARE